MLKNSSMRALLGSILVASGFLLILPAGLGLFNATEHSRDSKQIDHSLFAGLVDVRQERGTTLSAVLSDETEDAKVFARMNRYVAGVDAEWTDPEARLSLAGFAAFAELLTNTQRAQGVGKTALSN